MADTATPTGATAHFTQSREEGCVLLGVQKSGHILGAAFRWAEATDVKTLTTSKQSYAVSEAQRKSVQNERPGESQCGGCTAVSLTLFILGFMCLQHTKGCDTLVKDILVQHMNCRVVHTHGSVMKLAVTIHTQTLLDISGAMPQECLPWLSEKTAPVYF